MLEDLQDVEFAKAHEVLAAVAMNESQDWPSLLNGRTTMPLLQSFCSYTLADVDVLSNPTNTKVLSASLVLFRDADLAAAACDLVPENGYRRMILMKATSVAEQLDIVERVLIQQKVSKNEKESEDDEIISDIIIHSHETSLAGGFYVKNQNSPSPQNPQQKHQSPSNQKRTGSASSTGTSSSSKQKRNFMATISMSHQQQLEEAQRQEQNMLRSSLVHRMRNLASTIHNSFSPSVSSQRNRQKQHTPTKVGLRAFTEKTRTNHSSMLSSLNPNSFGNNNNNKTVNKKVRFLGSRSPSPFS
jgi:hypothetical protein